jgi:hypothetical protein
MEAIFLTLGIPWKFQGICIDLENMFDTKERNDRLTYLLTGRRKL